MSAGARARADDINQIIAFIPRYFTKSSATTYTSNAVLTNDTELSFAMEANTTYEVRIQGAIGGTAGDIQTAWSVPAGATGSKMCSGPEPASTDRTNTNARFGNHGHTTAITYGVNDAVSLAAIQEVGRVVTSAAGTFVWQHAQATSNAASSSIGGNSYLCVTKIA